MSYIYLLAGENLGLAEAELHGFLESQGVQENPERYDRLAETEAEPYQLKRLAFVHEVSEKVCELDGVGSSVDYSPEGSYAVRADILEGDEESKEVEKVLGNKMSSQDNEVDLENPDEVFKAYVTEGKIFLGRIVVEINRGLFEGRKNDNRAFSSPVSLDPVLARSLVNLSGLEAGKYVLDPFCGTGGILIEAGLCGIGVKGVDVQEEMVEGCRKNLEEYGIISYDVKKGDIAEIEEIADLDFSGVITDLPYGQASVKNGRPVEEFISFIEDFGGPVVFVYDEEELGDYTAEFSVYVHGSLTRYIFVE